MTPEHWQRIKPLLESALERDAGERTAFLNQACAGDELLRKELDSFIVSHERAESFIEEPAFKMMAESIVNTQADSMVGHSFGNYEIIEQLGAGGMGEVYLAQDARLGRKVALKMLPAYFTAHDERVL
jgi:eukaryotic-like serine/threonine-protein kinase